MNTGLIKEKAHCSKHQRRKKESIWSRGWRSHLEDICFCFFQPDRETQSEVTLNQFWRPNWVKTGYKRKNYLWFTLTPLKRAARLPRLWANFSGTAYVPVEKVSSVARTTCLSFSFSQILAFGALQCIQAFEYLSYFFSVCSWSVDGNYLIPHNQK